MTRFVYYLYRITDFFNQYCSLTVFLIVLVGMVGLDIGFHNYLFHHYVLFVHELFGISLETSQLVDMGWLPEVWLALLALVVGTLIIVISIAAQNVPGIIGLYIRDWLSLFYLWFIILSCVHAIMIKFYSEAGSIRLSSAVLNLHFLLVISSLLALPYIFYILQRTRPTNVIKIILSKNLMLLRFLPSRPFHILFQLPTVVEEYQYRLCKSLNQLDDLLEYTDFKEPEVEVIVSMSQSLQEYIRIKSSISPLFFKVTPTICSDISFKFHAPEQFEETEQAGTFYEEKFSLILDGIYIKLLNDKQYQLSSLIYQEVSKVGLAAIHSGDDELVQMIMIQFNTLLRFTIKQTIADHDVRNLFNAVFGYRRLVEFLVEHKKVQHVKRSFSYLRIYGIEIFKHAKQIPSMYFTVDAIAAEMKNILIRIYNDQWDIEIQNELLSEMLLVDSPPDFNKEDLDRGVLINNGVRTLQIGLALFYQKETMNNFVLRIIQDILEDLEVLGEETFYQTIENTCARLSSMEAVFWERTDRGNMNIYYTSDQDQIERFKALLYKQTEEHILNQLSARYQLTAEEKQLIWKLAKLTNDTVLSSMFTTLELFEKAVSSFENKDPETLSRLESIRRKLQLDLDNENIP